MAIEARGVAAEERTSILCLRGLGHRVTRPFRGSLQRSTLGKAVRKQAQHTFSAGGCLRLKGPSVLGQKEHRRDAGRCLAQCKTAHTDTPNFLLGQKPWDVKRTGSAVYRFPELDCTPHSSDATRGSRLNRSCKVGSWCRTCPYAQPQRLVKGLWFDRERRRVCRSGVRPELHCRLSEPVAESFAQTVRYFGEPIGVHCRGGDHLHILWSDRFLHGANRESDSFFFRIKVRRYRRVKEVFTICCVYMP